MGFVDREGAGGGEEKKWGREPQERQKGGESPGSIRLRKGRSRVGAAGLRGKPSEIIRVPGAKGAGSVGGGEKGQGAERLKGNRSIYAINQLKKGESSIGKGRTRTRRFEDQDGGSTCKTNSSGVPYRKRIKEKVREAVEAGCGESGLSKLQSREGGRTGHQKTAETKMHVRTVAELKDVKG